MLVQRDAWVEIDRQKLVHNFMEVRRAVGDHVKICAVLKAQCYGMSGPLVAETFDRLGADRRRGGQERRTDADGAL